MAEENSPASYSSISRKRVCFECKITLNDIYKYTEHLDSKEHRECVKEKRYGAQYLEAQTKRANPTSDMESENEEEKELQEFTCKECNKVILGQLNYEIHKNGKKHARNVKRASSVFGCKEEKASQGDTHPVEDDDSIMDIAYLDCKDSLPSDFHCKTCDTICSGPEPFIAHVQSRRHKRKEESLKHLTSMAAAGGPENNESKYKGSNIFQKEFSGVSPYQKYEKNPKYLESVQKPELKKSQQPFLSTIEEHIESERNLQPEELNKCFASPVEIAVPSVLEQKKEFLEMIHVQYPEITVRRSDTKDDDGGEDYIFFCTTCTVTLASFQTAQQHIESTKHKYKLLRGPRFKF